MLEYSHILYAIDINDNVDPLIQKVMASTTRSNTTITVVYYVKSFTAAYGGVALYVSYDSLEDKIVDHSREKLITLFNQYELNQERLLVEVTHDIKTAILDKAKELDVDVIYLNGHKHNPLGRLGSVADYVINNATCDVVILKK